MLRAVLGAALVSAALAPAPAEATTYCPRVLHRATRLIVVLVPDMNTHKGTVRTFERALPSASWKKVTEPEPVVVGANGIAWGHPFQSFAKDKEPLKQEGDRRTPAGIYRFGHTFGLDEAKRRDHLRLKPGMHVCVDDARSPLYGHIVDKKKAGAAARGEDMADVKLYKRGLVIDYPARRHKKAGSCVFLHVWEAADKGTRGCVALPEERVTHFQSWAKDRHAVIAILAETTVDRFRHCLPLRENKTAPAKAVAAGGKPGNTRVTALPVPNPDRVRRQRSSSAAQSGATVGASAKSEQ